MCSSIARPSSVLSELPPAGRSLSNSTLTFAAPVGVAADLEPEVAHRALIGADVTIGIHGDGDGVTAELDEVPHRVHRAGGELPPLPGRFVVLVVEVDPDQVLPLVGHGAMLNVRNV